jgi:CheY-like chemotaxis protein
MDRRHRVLVAAQPAAMIALARVLGPALEAVYVHTMADALRALEAGGIDAIVCTIKFDESRMMELLQAVKALPACRAIPFICARVLSSALSDQLVEQLGTACRECGAAGFVDLARLPEAEARAALGAALGARL